MDYAALAAQTKQQVDAYGADVVVTRATPASYDEASGTFASETTSTYAVKAVVSSKSKRRQGQGHADGTLVSVAGLSFLIAATSLAIVPAAGDTITFNRAVYTVDSCEPVYPGGVGLLYRAFCLV